MKTLQQLGGLWRHLRKLVRSVAIPCLLGISVASILVFQFWVLPARSQPPVVLTMLMQGQAIFSWKPFFQEFQDKNPGIQINPIEGPSDTNLQENLLTSAFLLGESPYDIINMDIVWVPKFAAAGWVMDLTDRISEAELSQFVKGDVEGGRYQGRLYRIPQSSESGVFYYRKDLLEQAGVKPPETFEQMVKIARDLQKLENSRWGYLWQGKQYEGVSAMFIEVLEGFGGFWTNPETLEVGLDQPQAIQAVEFLSSTIANGLSPRGVTTYTEEETRLLFQNGGAVFLRNWPYVWRLANQEDSKVKDKVGIKPMIHASGHTGGSCLGGWGWGISKTTRNPEEAWKLIQFLNSKETQRKIILETGLVPSYVSLFNDPEIVAKYPHYPQLLKVVQKPVLRPPIAQYAQASDVLQRYLSAAFTGRMSAEQAMKAAAKETRSILGQGVKSQKSGVRETQEKHSV